MQLMRCKCGKAEIYHSGMHPRDCQGCDECGTTFAYRPSDHKPREPHDWQPRFDPKTGAPDRPMCKRCYARGPKPETA